MTAADDSMKIEIMEFIDTQAPDSTFVKMPYNVFCVYSEQRVKKVQGWLRDFLKHKPLCGSNEKKACDCGLNDALNRQF